MSICAYRPFVQKCLCAYFTRFHSVVRVQNSLVFTIFPVKKNKCFQKRHLLYKVFLNHISLKVYTFVLELILGTGHFCTHFTFITHIIAAKL